MDTVCRGKQWDVALAYDTQGNITAALPYLIGSKMGLRFVVQPQLTQYNGPWYRPNCDTLEATHQLQQQIRKLHLALFLQNFAPGVAPDNYWNGFSCSPRPTYRIDDISDPDQVFANFDKRKRQRAIRNAAEVLHIDDTLTPDFFAQFHANYWQSRGSQDLLSQDFITSIVTTAINRGQGILIGARDDNGTLHGARFVAFDSHCAYALLSALNPQGHHNGTSPFMFWEIIQRLSTQTQSFDFEGSTDPGIAYSYSLYGSHPATYHQVFRSFIPFIKKILKIS